MHGHSFVMLLSGGETLWEKLSAWYQNSLLCELLNYIGNTYFSVDFGVYDNFSVPASAGKNARNIILAALLGIVIASIMTAYYRNGPGGFVRKLLREEIHSADKAKTLFELGYFRSTMIRRELSRGSALRMVVRCREEEEAPVTAGRQKPTKIDFTKAHFYIPEELRYRADVRFDNAGSGWKPVIATAVIAVFVASVLCWFLPDILHLADNLITVFAP